MDLNCKVDSRSAAKIIELIKESSSIPSNEIETDGQKALAESCDVQWNDKMNVYKVLFQRELSWFNSLRISLYAAVCKEEIVST